MIPILSDSGTLQGNGLGGLSDAIECVVTDEINGQYEMMMRYPVTGEHFGDLQNNYVIFAEPMALASAQPFRIYRITKPLNGVVTVYARHIAYDMSGIIVKPFTALNLTSALAAVPTYSVPSCPFTLTSTRTVSSKMSVEEPIALWSLLGGTSGSFLDVYGGEWEFDNYTAELKTRLGADRGVVIRYGKNMTELENDSDLQSTYGGVFPYWYDEEEGLVTLTEGFVPVSGTIYTRILLLDCSGDFEMKPSEADLRTRATNYITANSVGSPKDSWKVSFALLAQAKEYETQAILEAVQLGDTVAVKYEALGVDASARVVKTEWDVLGDKYKSVTIGRVKQNLASILVGQNRETEKAIAQTKSFLEKQIDSATDFIKNGSGVMRFIYNADGDLMEIVSLDNADISQAQSVWRWNNGGFGHSSTGYNGVYSTAITQQGAIVADFITAGTMAANRVRTGLLIDETGNNYWNLDTGDFQIQALSDVENRVSVNESGISLVSQKLENIGGRNILKNSETAVANMWTFYGGGSATFTDGITVSEWSCTDAKRAVGTSGNNGIAVMALNTYQATYPTINGRKYVFSIWLKNLGTSRIRLNSNGGTWSEYLETGEAKRVVAYQTGDGVANVQLRIETENVSQPFDFIWWHPQIEYGEVVTDWSPAPEDKVGNNEIISKINVSPENIVISANKVDLQGYVTFTNLSTSGQTSINGGNISAGTIALTALNSTTQNRINGALTGAVPVYYRSTTSTAPGKPSSAVTSTAVDTSGAWTLVMPRPKNGCYFWECEQNTAADGTVTWSTVREIANASYTSKWAASANATYIDGGQIYTGSITADRIKANETFTQNLTATNFNITGGSIDIQTDSSTADKISLKYTPGTGSAFSWVTTPSGTSVSQTVLSTGQMWNSSYASGSVSIQYRPTASDTLRLRSNLSIGSLEFFDLSGVSRLVVDSTNTRYLLKNSTGGIVTNLTTSGLTFYDSSNNVTASYPATGMPKYDTGYVRYTIASSWTLAGELTIQEEGIYAVFGAQSYNNSRPVAVSLVIYSGTYERNLATNTDMESHGGITIARIDTSCIVACGAGEKLRLYAKAGGGGNDCRLYARKLA